MPSRYFVRGTLRVRRDQMLPEPVLRDILARHRFSISTISYQLSGGGEVFEYHLLIRTIDRKHLRQLCESLLKETLVLEFQLNAIAN